MADTLETTGQRGQLYPMLHNYVLTRHVPDVRFGTSADADADANVTLSYLWMRVRPCELIICADADANVMASFFTS